MLLVASNYSENAIPSHLHGSMNVNEEIRQLATRGSTYNEKIQVYDNLMLCSKTQCVFIRIKHLPGEQTSVRVVVVCPVSFFPASPFCTLLFIP